MSKNNTGEEITHITRILKNSRRLTMKEDINNDLSMRQGYWVQKQEFYKLFVDENVPYGGNGDAWPGEEGTEYKTVFKEDLDPTKVWIFLNDIIENILNSRIRDINKQVIDKTK